MHEASGLGVLKTRKVGFSRFGMVFSLIGALKKRKMSPKLQLLSSNGEPVVVPFEAVYAKPGIREQLDQLIDQDKEN